MLSGALAAFLAYSSLPKCNFNELDILTTGMPLLCVPADF